MSIPLSRIVQSLEPSATIAMATKAKELKATGKTVYDFSLGEPDFTTPQHICEAAVRAMQDGHTHYTAASGVPELKAAVARQYSEVHGITYEPSGVVVSNGAKHSLHNIFTAILDPGDEVIIPAPYWVSYSEIVKLAGGVPVIVPTSEESGFKLTAGQLAEAAGPRTTTLLLCSPSNPTGCMYDKAELLALADVAVEKDLFVVSDEIYEQLVYDGAEFASFTTLRPDLKDRCVVVNGVSKAYAMTGWRIGWTLSPEPLAKAMSKVQGQETSNPSSISQYAAIAAIEGPQECVAEMLSEFADRREYVLGRLGAIEGVSCPRPGGAFYAFFNIQRFLGRTFDGKRIDNSADWCLRLLEDRCVATVMGSAFGAEGYVRLSFATSMDALQGGLDRIEEFLTSAV